MNFFSKSGQDQFVFQNFYRGRRNGVFVDIGAYDGERFSNSLFFERFLGWRGLCVEPSTTAFAHLRSKRRSINEQVCIANTDGQAEFIEFQSDEAAGSNGLLEYLDAKLKNASTQQQSIRTPTVRLSSLLERHRLFDIDYCSVDVNGAEQAVLQDLDFTRFRIAVLSVADPHEDPLIAQLLKKSGYELVARLGTDLIFRRRDVAVLPLTSVICAVWHGDTQRWDLLRGHADNLANQTVPVEPIYVFDGPDDPPEWLPGRKVAVREPLTIYQAWNVALSLVSTPLVMNLNLDDRLATDAVATLQAFLSREGAAMVGGDWKICYSQSETDAATTCYAADELPFVAQWPPPAGTVTRLGSGTGARGTFGPAVMWRLDTHIGAPRYTWRLPEGTLLRVAGDSGWWIVVTQHLKKKAMRYPGIIGHYFSHPSSQAEFRHDTDEVALLQQLGVSLV